ncbi:MAG: alpha/beta hydrolase family protein [Planctomycetota bacterium]
MLLLGLATAFLCLVSLVAAALVQLIRSFSGHPPATGYWRRVLLIHLLLIPFYLFGMVPITLGMIAPNLVGTRPDERFYAGPWIRADGSWQLQSRQRPGAVRSGRPADARSDTDFIRDIESSDGLRLRTYLVPPIAPAKNVTVVLVHGLFRGGLELEPIAAMFRELGAEVMLLELRSHGASEASSFSFGPRESLDVIAAVEWLQAQGREKIVLFGVSLGTAAVALACERLRGISALVLEAPMGEFLETAHGMLGLGRMGIPQPFRGIMLAALGWRLGIDWDDVRPGEQLAALPEDTPVLLIGGGLDQRMRPESVREIFTSLPTREDRRELWIRADSGHGSVSQDDPEGYKQRLARILERIR